MIKINIDVSEDMVLRKIIGESIHKSLVGSPAYINNEILLNVDASPNNIILIVGKDNENDTELNVKFRSISKITEVNEDTSKDYKFSNFSNKNEVLLNSIFSSITDGLLSAQNKRVLSTSDKPLCSGCFEDKNSVWVQKFVIVFDKDLEAAIDRLLIEFGTKNILSEKSTSAFEYAQMSVDTGYAKIKDDGNTIYIFVVSKPKKMIGGDLEFLQKILYSTIHRIISSLPDKFFNDHYSDYYE